MALIGECVDLGEVLPEESLNFVVFGAVLGTLEEPLQHYYKLDNMIMLCPFMTRKSWDMVRYPSA